MQFFELHWLGVGHSPASPRDKSLPASLYRQRLTLAICSYTQDYNMVIILSKNNRPYDTSSGAFNDYVLVRSKDVSNVYAYNVLFLKDYVHVESPLLVGGHSALDITIDELLRFRDYTLIDDESIDRDSFLPQNLGLTIKVLASYGKL